MACKSVIIIRAITGSLHTPSMSPYLPITPDEIITESVAAAEAGASIIHLHGRDPKDARLTIRWLPINATDEERATFAAAKEGMKQGWSGTLDQLAEYLAGQ